MNYLLSEVMFTSLHIYWDSPPRFFFPFFFSFFVFYARENQIVTAVLGVLFLEKDSTIEKEIYTFVPFPPKCFLYVLYKYMKSLLVRNHFEMFLFPEKKSSSVERCKYVIDAHKYIRTGLKLYLLF